jgi:hypothetical protein
MQFAKPGAREKVKFASRLTAHGDELREAALAGCGIVRLLACHVEDELRTGALAAISLTLAGGRRLFDKSELESLPPRNRNRFVAEVGSKNDREVGAAVEANRDFALADADIGRHVDQVPEDLTGLRILVAAHAVGH